jgi:phenylacetate-CoA ligase
MIRAALYFAAQRRRGGVTPGLIRQASTLLDSPWPHVLGHVETRLRAMYGPAANPLDWLLEQPVVERSSLRPNADSLMAAGIDVRHERKKTSGSTGTPFSLVKDMEMAAWIDAVMWSVYGWYGIQPGDAHARFWGMPREIGARARRRLNDWFLNRRRLNAFDLSDKTSARFLKSLERSRPRYVHGYPTLISAFTDQCLANGRSGTHLGVRVVFCTGELLTPETRQRISSFFGCRVVNEYGCTESGLLAFDCEHGRPHVLPVAAFPEVVTSDDPHTRTDGDGEVIVTDLFGSLMPLLRYRLHDRARLSFAAACPCGRALPLLEVVDGRTDSFILTPTGMKYDAILAYSAPPGVNRFRAYQTTPDSLDVHVQLSPGAPPSVLDQFATLLGQQLGPSMRINMKQVDSIPFEASGKLRYFVPLQPAGNGRTNTSDGR